MTGKLCYRSSYYKVRMFNTQDFDGQVEVERCGAKNKFMHT